MIIYKAEADIANLLEEQRSVSYLAKVEKSEVFPVQKLDKTFASLEPNTQTPNSKDLYYTKSLFVSTIWNENDDVFDPVECWGARKTPVDKPTNIEHDQNLIVGHITSQWAINTDGSIIDDETYSDDLPSVYHICNGAVIYLAWSDENKRKLVQDLITGIEAGEYFVSMECLFSQFDYALSNKSTGKVQIVNRNQDTAFLTKYLRAYNGKGEYEDYRIGRFLRNMIFSGKAYTKNPANPESIIFNKNNCKVFDFACAKLENAFLLDNCVDKNEEKQLMSDNTRNFEAELAEAKANEKIATANIDKLTADIEKLNSVVAEKDKALAACCKECEDMEAIQKKCNDLSKSNEMLSKDNDELTKKVSMLEAQTMAAVRLSQLIEAGIDKSQAKEIVLKFANLNDEQFDSIASVYKSKIVQTNTDTTLIDNAQTDNANASVGAVNFNKDDQDFEALQKAVSSILETVQE